MDQDEEDNYDSDAETGGPGEDGDSMSFLEHLEEFRWTLARSLLAFILGASLVGVFIGDVSHLLQLPLARAYGSVETMRESLITYRPMGVISVFIQIVFLGGLTLSMPFALYFIAAFVAPGLTERERAVVRPTCFAAFLLFVAGVAFAFFVILPLTLAFSVRLNQFLGFELFWAASDYYNMVVWFSVAVGAFFQFPLIIVLLVYMDVLPVRKLRAIRRPVLVGLLVFAALLTPGGDFISLPLTTSFMYGLYELAIVVGARVERVRRERAVCEWED